MAEDEDKDRDAMQRILEKSEDDFEKYLTFISAGALGLSITFMEKLVLLEDAKSVYWLIGGWIFLALTLLVNLFSHIYSAKLNDKSIVDKDKGVKDLNKRISRRNRKVDRVNYFSIGTLCIGIICTLIFTSINAIKMSNSKDRQTKPSREGYEEHGRRIPQPKPSKPAVKPKK